MELYGRGEGNDQTGILTNMKLEKDEQIARLFLAFSHLVFREVKEFREFREISNLSNFPNFKEI